MNGIAEIFGLFFGGSGFSKCDAAALKVAMMVAALDGCIEAGELAEFDRLAKLCRGYTEKNAAELVDSGIRSAGYIEIQSRRLPEAEAVKLFVREALDTLPPEFYIGDTANARRAFAIWVMIAMSDDYYAGIERKAIEALFTSVTGAMDACTRYQGIATVVPLERNLLSRLENIMSRMKHEATESDARGELKQLIGE